MDRHDETKTHYPIPITMQRRRRPSHLILHSPPQPFTTSPTSRLPKTAPCEPPSLPKLSIQPATGTSLNFTSPPSALRVSHRSSTASLSTFTGVNPPSPRDDTEGSNETIRGVAPDTSSIQQSEYDGPYDERSVEEETQPLNRYFFTRSPKYGSIRRASFPGSPEVGGVTRVSVMHGVWLALQCCVFLAVFGVLVSITIWQSSRSDSEFWKWIWTVPQPILLSLSVSAFAILLIHELHGLSTVILLYLQSAILVIVTATCLSLSAQSFEQDSLAVKAAVLGCATTLWGWTVLSFARVALIWRVESQREELRLFAP